MKPEQVRLYVVTDPRYTPPDVLVPACVAAVEGGATLVQLRDKDADDQTLLAQAISLRDALEPLGVPLVVNDRIDVAEAAGVGVHVGVSDDPPAYARDRLGPSAIVGWSIEDFKQLDDDAQLCSCSYLAASPVWATPTKTDAAEPLGLAGISQIRKVTGLRLVGIGGVNSRERAAEVVAAGADGVAVVSTIFNAVHPRVAAAEMRDAVDTAVAERLGES
jgi:thiamine-phosphate pyrophosphorylase